jgi:hypothetical protein
MTGAVCSGGYNGNEQPETIQTPACRVFKEFTAVSQKIIFGYPYPLLSAGACDPAF